ncbi:hypothetical protein ADUPG1_004950, partial [Aduncisulcus paluster]
PQITLSSRQTRTADKEEIAELVERTTNAQTPRNSEKKIERTRASKSHIKKTVDKELEVNLTDLALDHMTFYAQKPYSKSSITLTELAGLATNGESLSERNQAAKDLQTRMSHKKHNADSLVRDGKSGKAYSRCNDTSPGSSISWQTIDKVPAWESSSILSVSTELIKKTLDRIHNTAISGVTGITGQAFKLACNNDHERAFLKQSVNNFLNTGNIDRVVCLKRLIALPKGEDKIRPVTPGEVVGKVFGEVLRSYLEGPVKKLLGD